MMKFPMAKLLTLHQIYKGKATPFKPSPVRRQTVSFMEASLCMRLF